MIEHGRVVDAVAELSVMFEGDGAALQVTGVDEQRGQVELSLELDGVDCSDCVLPPTRLREVVDSNLRRSLPGLRTLLLIDPRDGAADPGTVEVRPASGPNTLTVLDPTGAGATGNPDPGPDAGTLAGRSVGFRVDVLWSAWDWTVEEWTRELEGAGVRVTAWRRAQGLKGQQGERKQAEYDAFVGSVDVVVSGLANCGSCTSWSVGDGLNALHRGLPTAVAVTEQFEGLARTLAADRGSPGVRLIVLPFSLHTLPEEEVRRHAQLAFPRLLEVLGARLV